MNTMNRCLKTFSAIFSIAACASLTLPLATFHTESAAQTLGVRNFPAKALRGKLVVQLPPDVLLDGQADRLSPGSRIHDTRNMLAMSGALVGQTLTVNYLRDGAGLIHEVWILTPEEAAEKRAGAKGDTLFNFSFASDTPTTKRDDGKTPFNQLPVYPNQ
jgi:hypothetical protein